MDVSTIIAKSRVQTNTSIGQKSDALMLADLNTIYGNIFGVLNTASKKYTRQTYNINTVANTNKYTIPVLATPITGLSRVLNVSIKYGSDKDYIPLKKYDTSIAVDSDYTDTNNPYCIERDGSIYIYPAPTTSVTSGIVIDGNYQPLALELTTLSAAIKLAADSHDLLLYGLNMMNFADKLLVDKQIAQKQLLDAGIATLITQGWADMESWYETSYSEIYNQSTIFLP